jgi:hypothetical protein
MSDIQSQQNYSIVVLTSSSVCVLLGEVALWSDALCSHSGSLQSFLTQPRCLVPWRVPQIWYLWRCLNQRRFCNNNEINRDTSSRDAICENTMSWQCTLFISVKVLSLIDSHTHIIPVALLGWSETIIVSESKMDAIVARWGCGSEVNGLLSCFSSSESELLSTTTVYDLTPGLPPYVHALLVNFVHESIFMIYLILSCVSFVSAFSLVTLTKDSPLTVRIRSPFFNLPSCKTLKLLVTFTLQTFSRL